MKDITRKQYEAVSDLLDLCAGGAFPLTQIRKRISRKLYHRIGCGSLFTGLVWSMDEYDVPDYIVKWKGLPDRKGTRVIVVSVESPHRQILAVLLIYGQPKLSDYCKALWMALHNDQQLTDMPPYRPAILITDNCGAAVKGLGFKRFCRGLRIAHRPAHYGTPHAKIATEAINYVLERLTAPILNDVAFEFCGESGPKILCDAGLFFLYVIEYARLFNQGVPREGKLTRAQMAVRNFEWFCEPLDSDGLRAPRPWFLETVRLQNNIVTVGDGKEFYLDTCLKDGDYLNQPRHIFDEWIKITFDGVVYEAIPIPDTGPRTCLT